MYVYIKSETNLWTVGFYKPSGEWEPESDCGSTQVAAERVHYLNGGGLSEQVQEQEEQIENLKDIVRALGTELRAEVVGFLNYRNLVKSG